MSTAAERSRYAQILIQQNPLRSSEEVRALLFRRFGRRFSAAYVVAAARALGLTEDGRPLPPSALPRAEAVRPSPGVHGAAARAREAYMRRLILQYPKLGADRLNERFRQRFGNTMRTRRVRELKRELGVDGGRLVSPAEAERAHRARRARVTVRLPRLPPEKESAPARAFRGGPGARLSFSAHAHEGPGEYAARVLDDLRKRGLCRVVVAAQSASTVVLKEG